MKNCYLVVSSVLLIALSANFAQASTVITVDWALDADADSSRHTCTYTQGSGALFAPAPDGKCTLRRAIREAGARSDEAQCPGCSPVTIRFTGLDGNNGDDDDAQYNVDLDQWRLPIDPGSSAADQFRLKGQGLTDVDGDITLVGPDYTGMPKILVESSRSLEIELTNVRVRQLGFIGGMSVIFKETNGEFSNNVWGLSPDGTRIFFQDLNNNADALAGARGVTATLKGSGLLVENNTFAGASGRAIDINFGTSGVRILRNRIGIRADGTVPVVPNDLRCRGFDNLSNPNIDASEWFGGWGISAAGEGLMIQGNVLAGLQNIRRPNDTAPFAIEVFGALHTIDDNIIGRDATGGRIGVCGLGIKFSVTSGIVSAGHKIRNNLIDGARDGGILWTDSSNSSQRDGGTTLRGNIVVDGGGRYFDIGPLLSSALRAFEPGEITAFSGRRVSGVSDRRNADGVPSPCPKCVIDFYLDDRDKLEEGLAYLGATTAADDGSFSFMLDEPLDDGFGIRTTSTPQSDDVIPNAFAGTTSSLSRPVFSPETIADVLSIFNDQFED